MPEIEMLRRLIEEGGVPVNVLARLCQCSPTSIFNYIRKGAIPTGSKYIGIREGLIKYKELVNNIINF